MKPNWAKPTDEGGELWALTVLARCLGCHKDATSWRTWVNSCKFHVLSCKPAIATRFSYRMIKNLQSTQSKMVRDVWILFHEEIIESDVCKSWRSFLSVKPFAMTRLWGSQSHSPLGARFHTHYASRDVLLGNFRSFGPVALWFVASKLAALAQIVQDLVLNIAHWKQELLEKLGFFTVKMHTTKIYIWTALFPTAPQAGLFRENILVRVKYHRFTAKSISKRAWRKENNIALACFPLAPSMQHDQSWLQIYL